MRLALSLLALLLLPPLALAHGSHGLHLRDVELAYAPLAPGQQLRFVVVNDATGDAVDLRAHVTLRDALFRETRHLPPLAAGEEASIALDLPLRVAPHACVFVTASGRSSDDACALATAAPALVR